MRKSLLAVGVILLLVPGLLQAATTSRLTGTVVDKDDVALPGVTVSLSSDVLIGGTHVAITDVNGNFAYNLLPPGSYTVRTDLAGFRAGEVTARVALDRDTQVRIMMVMEEFADEIVVTAEAPVVDTTNVTSGESFNEEFLQNAATSMGSRDYLAIIGQAAGTGGGTGNINVMGGVLTDNVYLIDGMNTTDPITATFGTNYNFDAIQEVSIQTSGFEAEFGQALGGIVNLVTKSGGNEFSGAFDARYRDENFYESGEWYDPDRNIASLREISATMGGPILRDRLWFFVSVGDTLSKSTPVGAVLTRQFDGTDWMAKATWQAADSVRVTAKISGDPAEIDNSNRNPPLRYYAADAGSHQDQGGEIYSADLNWVASDSLLLSLQAGFNDGYLDSYPMSGDLYTSGYYNEETGIYFNNYDNAQYSERDSKQAKTALSYFVEDLLGPHEFKVGVEYREIYYSGNNFFTGGGRYYVQTEYDPVTNPGGLGCPNCDFDGDGWVDHTLRVSVGGVEAGMATTEAIGDLYTYYAQDAWRPVPNLTVKPGLRLDTVEYTNDVGDTIADFDELQPRVGLAWDFLNDGKQVIRANWGRFMHPGSSNLADTVSGRTPGWFYWEYTGYESFCRWPGTPMCDREWLAANMAVDGQEHVTVDQFGNEHYWYRTGGFVLDNFESVDTLGVGHLEAQWMETFSLAIERQLWDETSLEIEYVNKNSRDLIEDVCNNNTWIWDDTVPPADLNDPSTWPDEADCTGYVLANVEGMRRDYEAYIVKFESRLGALHILGNYTYSESTGNSSSDATFSYASGSYDSFPRDYYNLYGYMPDDQRHRVNVNGYVDIPWDMTFAFDYYWMSAPALDVLGSCAVLASQTDERLLELGIDPELRQYCTGAGDMYFEPRGSRRGSAEYQLDLSFSKAFTIKSVSLEAIVAVVNAWGDERPTNYNQDPFISSGAGTPDAYTAPRHYEVGIRFEF